MTVSIGRAKIEAPCADLGIGIGPPEDWRQGGSSSREHQNSPFGLRDRAVFALIGVHAVALDHVGLGLKLQRAQDHDKPFVAVFDSAGELVKLGCFGPKVLHSNHIE